MINPKLIICTILVKMPLKSMFPKIKSLRMKNKILNMLKKTRIDTIHFFMVVILIRSPHLHIIHKPFSVQSEGGFLLLCSYV